MTAENQNEKSSNERLDQRNLSVQGSVDKSTLIVGDQNTVNQESSYYTTNVVSSFEAEQLRAQHRHLRRQLLKQMKTDVAQRLEDSLHNLIRVDLEQEEQRYQVGRRRKLPLAEVTPKSPQASHRLVKRELTVSNNNEAREFIPPAEQTYNIFHRSDIGGRLLILGEPGAGKTTELLMVAQRLIDAAIEDNDQPIPLIFELSSWKPNTPILTWLEQQLQKSYGVSKKLAESLATQWIQQTQILPLLDGLDELGQSKQAACINTLEDFLALHPALSVLICCRREEYEEGGAQLKQLKGAVYLQTVGLQQIQQYLTDLGREQLWEGIQSTPELLKLAQLPLFLTMLVIAYHGQPIRDKSSLFNAYIQKQLYEPSYQGSYRPGEEKSPQKTLYYLGWLARQLEKRKQTELFIENLHCGWLTSKQQKQTHKLSVVLIIRLIGTLTFGLIGTLTFGLIGSLAFGLMGALAFGPRGIAILEDFRTPISGRFNNFLNAFADLMIQLIFGLMGALTFGLMGALTFGLMGALTFGLMGALTFGLAMSLIGNLIDAIIRTTEYCVLRIILTKNGYIPWNYAQFLEHATRHRFIQRTGGRYRFVHDLLKQHFAQMTPEQQADLAQPTSSNRP